MYIKYFIAKKVQHIRQDQGPCGIGQVGDEAATLALEMLYIQAAKKGEVACTSIYGNATRYLFYQFPNDSIG